MSASAQCFEEEPIQPEVLMAGVNASPQGLAVVGGGRILYANRAFARTSGRAGAWELRGRSLTDSLPENTRLVEFRDDDPRFCRLPSQIEVFTSPFEENHRNFQVVSVMTTFPAKTDGLPDWDPAKTEVGQSQAGIAHDFGNLITGILLYSDLLIAGLKNEDRLRRHAEAIQTSGINGVRLIEKLMAPVHGHKLPVQPSSFSQVASEMASFLRRLVGGAIEIQLQLAEPLGMVQIDPLQCHQIIMNLVQNARDAMPVGGKILIESRNCNTHFANSDSGQPVPAVEFSVSDTGSGMDKKTLSQVLRPFFTTKSRNKGTGLGLAIVNSAVKNAGGEVEIQSVLGTGTRVALKIPRVDVPHNTKSGNDGQISRRISQ